MQALEAMNRLDSMDMGILDLPAFDLPFDPEALLLDDAPIDPDFDKWLANELGDVNSPVQSSGHSGTSSASAFGQSTGDPQRSSSDGFPRGLYELFQVEDTDWLLQPDGLEGIAQPLATSSAADAVRLEYSPAGYAVGPDNFDLAYNVPALPAAYQQYNPAGQSELLYSPPVATSGFQAAAVNSYVRERMDANGCEGHCVAVFLFVQERQRDTISSLEAELSDKLAQLQVLAAENELLKLRSTVLEATVKGRECQMKIFQEYGPPVFPFDEAEQQAAEDVGVAAPLAKQPCSSSSHSTQQQHALCNSDLTADTACTAAIRAAVSEEISHDSCGTKPGCPNLDKADDPQNAPEAIQRKTIRCIKKMSPAGITRHWKQFLQDVTGELLAAEEEEEQLHVHLQEQEQQLAAATASAVAAQLSGSRSATAVAAGGGCGAAAVDDESRSFCTPSERRIIALVAKYQYIVKYVALLNPGALYSMLGRNLDTGLAQPYTDMHWRQVVAQLELSTTQVTQVLACAELYFSSLKRLYQERQQLQQHLRAADEGLSECQRRLLGSDGIQHQLQLLDQLQSNLKREHVLRIMMNCFVWGRSLNSLQFAKSAVYSHPVSGSRQPAAGGWGQPAAGGWGRRPLLVFPHRAMADSPAGEAVVDVKGEQLYKQFIQQGQDLKAQSLGRVGA
eukprot:gene4392-4645_t